MVAAIAGFHTRADLGMRAPKSVSRNIDPSRGGVAVHYGGGPQGLGVRADHRRCMERWLSWQAFHMRATSLGGRGWTDIAYTGGFCDHGYAMAGRGAGIRTGANGTNVGNDYWYAVTWIGGEGETPSPAALDAADWWINELRQAGGAARRVVPHRYFKSTGCPGSPLVHYAGSRDGAAIALAPTTTPIEEDPMFMAWLRPKAGSNENVHCYRISGNTASWFPTEESIKTAQFLGLPWANGGGANAYLDPAVWQSLAILNGPLKNV